MGVDCQKIAASDSALLGPVVIWEIVKSYVRDSLSSLTPRHFWALSSTSLILTCVNSHLVTYAPLLPTTSRHRLFLIDQNCHYCIPTQYALHSDHVCHPRWASISILGIFTTSSLMLYARRSSSFHILFSNDSNEHSYSQTSPDYPLMYTLDHIELYSL